MESLEFYRDENGHPCVKGSDQRLATFIETDLQESEAVISALIEQLNNEEDSDFEGNAHSVAIRDVTATIEATIDDEAPDRRLPRQELLAAVESWLVFIRS